MTNVDDDKDHVGVAFALTFAAGAATCLGASLVFFPSLVKLASHRTLASALGLAAGVMTYVSLVEIFGEADAHFNDSGFSTAKAYLYTTLSFFAGVLIMVPLDILVKQLLNAGNSRAACPKQDRVKVSEATQKDSIEEVNGAGSEQTHTPCMYSSGDPVGDFSCVQEMAVQIEHKDLPNEQWEGTIPSHADDEEKGKSDPEAEAITNRQLLVMSLNTALAIGVHNFPEGLATFVATLSDPSVGAILAIAIALHNIPEGLCVAMPVYYATGHRWKAFSWALLSGMAEPFAALLGWAILADHFSHSVYGVMFSFVAGMMVVIAVRELIPTAHRYDPTDTVVTYSFMIGMAIMALSLVLFVV